MKTLKVALPAAILMAGFMLCTTSSFGKAEYAKKEGGKACTYCHVAMGKKDLNDTGKCYAKNEHSLAKCAAPAPAEKK
jgi:hypothetical protein